MKRKRRQNRCVGGRWSADEDAILRREVARAHAAVANGLMESVQWSSVALALPGRIGKQARERWYNHLDPTVRKGPWSKSEDTILVNSQLELGNRWTQIARRLPGRSDCSVKNRFHSLLRRWKSDGNELFIQRSVDAAVANSGSNDRGKGHSWRRSPRIRGRSKLKPSPLIVRCMQQSRIHF